MGMTTVNSLHALLEASNDALSRAHGAGIPAVLVVPSAFLGSAAQTCNFAILSPSASMS